MGSIVQGIFGGKKSSTSNKSYNELNSAFSPITSQAGTGADALSALLGGDATGFNNYKAATGFDGAAEAGSRGITGNAAASGLLRSGSTGKALEAYGTGLQNQYAQSYLGNLFNQANLGLDAGKVISGAGQTSTSSEKPGLFNAGSALGKGGGLGAFLGGLGLPI
jgi:hypothetical protein